MNWLMRQIRIGNTRIKFYWEMGNFFKFLKIEAHQNSYFVWLFERNGPLRRHNRYRVIHFMNVQFDRHFYNVPFVAMKLKEKRMLPNF